jgi:drug/metabolite transporter (DMT)-like permease
MMQRSTWFLVVAFVLMWNSGFIGAEYALSSAPAFTLVFWRYWALTGMLLLWLGVTGRLRWAGARPAGFVMLVGTLSHGVWLVCVMLALERDVPPGIVALVVSLQPLLTGALEGGITGGATPLFRWVGLLVGFSGVCVVLFNRIDFSDATSIFSNLIPTGAVVAISVASLLQRRADLEQSDAVLPADLNLFYQGLGTALAVSLPAVLLEGLSTQWDAQLVGTLMWLIVAVSLCAYGLMWKLIERMSATSVASLFYLGPPVTMLMAWFAFGDTLYISDIAGLGIVLAGVLITFRSTAAGEG